MRWPERFYRALLRCYPAEFRDEYAREMTQAFRDEWSAQRASTLARSHRRRLVHCPKGASPRAAAGPSLYRPDDVEGAGIHGRRGAYGRARDRCQHRHLQLRLRRHAAAVAVRGAPAPDAGDGKERQAEPSEVRRFGVELPFLGGTDADVRAAGRCRFRLVQLERTGRSRAVHRHQDQPVVDAAARREPGGRPRLSGRRGKTGQRAGGDDQRRPLEASVRRRGVARRTEPHAQRHRLHGGRHRAAGARSADRRRHLDAAHDRSRPRDPVESRDSGLRPPQAGRDAAAGAGRDGHDCDARGAAVSGGQGLGHQPRVHDRRIRGPAAPHRSVGAARRGRVRAADCVREHREPAAGARGIPPEGDCHSHRDGREPVAAAAAVARGERRAVARRRRRGNCRRRLGGASDQCGSAAESAADSRRRRRCRRVVVRGGDDPGDRRVVRPRAGVARGRRAT